MAYKRTPFISFRLCSGFILENAEAAMSELRNVQEAMPRELAAVIVFDSYTQPFPGSRGPTDERHVVARAEELDIHLKISTDPFKQGIVGQVFVRNDTRFVNTVRVQLLQDGNPFKTTWTDNFGQFEFNEVPSGGFHLQIDLPRLTIVTGISIGAQD
jgi:hypothetical protein